MALPHQSKVNMYADLQNPLQTLNQVLDLDAHILDNFAIPEDLLQAGQPHMAQPPFHKLLIHILTVKPDILQCPTLPNLIHITEDSDNIFQLHDAQENNNENELYIKFLEEHISNGLKTEHTYLGPWRDKDQTSTLIDYSTVVKCCYKVTQACML